MADRTATTSKTKKKPGRKRRVAGWVLLVIGVLIASVWGASGWWWLGCSTPKANVFIMSEQVGAAVHVGDSYLWHARGWFADRAPAGPSTRWQFRVSENPTNDPDMLRGVHVGIAAYFDIAMSQAWSPTGRVINDWERHVSVALWPFALASLLGGGWLMWSGRRAERRAMTGLCLKCGYDLRGLAAGRPCPECGKAAETVPR